MIDKKQIQEITEKQLEGSDLFVVDIKISAGNEIEVLVDSDTSVNIDRCVALSRAIEGALDRESENFQLTVASAGIGQPLKLLRQYKKLIGKDVELLLNNGEKIIARLIGATDDSTTIAYEEKIVVEGKKRKETVTTEREISLTEVKWTKEYLNFK